MLPKIRNKTIFSVSDFILILVMVEVYIPFDNLCGVCIIEVSCPGSVKILVKGKKSPCLGLICCEVLEGRLDFLGPCPRNIYGESSHK